MYKKNSAKLSGGVMAIDHSSLFHDNHSQFYIIFVLPPALAIMQFQVSPV